MAAYLIFVRERMRDETKFKTYSKLAHATIVGHDAKVRAFNGACETYEGAEAGGVVMLEFPTVLAARNWYESDAYQEARVHRLLSSDYRVFVTEGI